MAAMKAKQGTKSAGTCPTVLRGDDEKSLEAWKKEFCKGYRHVDLADETVKNIAMIDVSKDIVWGRFNARFVQSRPFPCKGQVYIANVLGGGYFASESKR